jgi:hypothetical protein
MLRVTDTIAIATYALVVGFLFLWGKRRAGAAVADARRAYERQDWEALRKALSDRRASFYSRLGEEYYYLILLKEHDQNLHEAQIACLLYLKKCPRGQRVEEVLQRFRTMQAIQPFDAVRAAKEDPCGYAHLAGTFQKIT